MFGGNAIWEKLLRRLNSWAISLAELNISFCLFEKNLSAVI